MLTGRDLWKGRIALSRLPWEKDEWGVTDDISFFDQEVGCWITVKEGARSDLASIPRFFWRIIGCPGTGLYVAAAVIHDQLYKTRGGGIYTKQSCDRILRDAALSCGVASWRAWAMYKAVQLNANPRSWACATAKQITAQMELLDIDFIGMPELGTGL